jgi:hypothetical protein
LVGRTFFIQEWESVAAVQQQHHLPMEDRMALSPTLPHGGVNVDKVVGAAVSSKCKETIGKPYRNKNGKVLQQCSSNTISP